MENITPQDIRNRATRALLTMDALFERANVKASTFWRWEKGKNEIRPLTLEKLRQALEAAEAEHAQ